VSNLLKYGSLIGINLVYACVTLFTKSASLYPFGSWQYVLNVCGAVAVLGLYAILWQQILKRIQLTDAYMFKGTSLIFVFLLSPLIFGERITTFNVIGAVIIVSGIVLYAKWK